MKQFLIRAAYILAGVAIVLSTQFFRFTGPEPIKDPQGISRDADDKDGTPGAGTAKDVRQASQTPDADAAMLAAAAPPPVEQPPAIAESCLGKTASGEPAVIADSLHIRVFELAPSAVGSPALPRAQTAAFERLDLSGTFSVAADGTLSLPSLGRVAVVGRSLPCVEALIEKTYYETNHSLSQVSADFAARQPVTVTGIVRTPGTYAYAAGMTVGRLLAQAGTAADGGAVSAQEYLSLIAQRQEVETRLLAVRIAGARVEAALAGQREIALGTGAPAGASPALVERLMHGETTALAADLDAVDLAAEKNESELKALTNRLAQARQELAEIDQQLKSQNERRDELLALRQKGMITSTMLDGIELSVMSLQRLRLELRGETLKLESELNLHARRVALALAERRQRLADQVGDYGAQEATLAAQLSGIDTRLASYSGQRGGPGKSLLIAIDRSGPQGAVRLPAAMETPLQPGDMVHVSIATVQRSAFRGDAAPGGTAQLLKAADKQELK